MVRKSVRIKRIPLLIAVVLLIPLLVVFLTKSFTMKSNPVETEHTNESIINDSIPVINTKKVIIKPYIDNDVKVIKGYYDYKGEEETQKNSIIVHDNMYIQNNGIDYSSEKEFDVVSVLEGQVTNIIEDESIGNTIEITHSNDYISVYQNVKDIQVKKGDAINQGQLLGKSSTNTIDKELGNHIHFELKLKDKYVNPEEYIDKEIKDKE